MIQFDCHAHVYETVTAVKGARYVPAAPAPLASSQAADAPDLSSLLLAVQDVLVRLFERRL